ncbi:helix-turn-helix domain-containing protein [Actinoalloteichus sp. GBA129-24]|uniref:helix-turn-helix domain-containing protein n=1 Tax=Actinoalloteichus sp. GBA129-24 TaxID=1612551 RepID=UPI00214FDA2A|nr:helix-turn-helix transcriptional regulator [Actinoalloteichus sp. GBA129-24]
MKGRPTIRHRRLCARLHRMRNDTGIEIEQVMAEMGWSRSTARRKENGTTSLSVTEVRALCALYRATAEQEAVLVGIAARLGEPDWWQPYAAGATGAFRDFLELESDASEVRNFEIDVVPGLLQTEGYVRALVESWIPRVPEATAHARISLRLARRQRLLTGPSTLWAIMDEAALRPRIVTGRAWQEQTAALLEFADHPNITLQVLPFSAGPHPAIGSPFAWLGLPAPDPGVVLLDNVAGSVAVEDAAEVQRFRNAFDHLRAMALAPSDTRSFLSTALRACP